MRTAGELKVPMANIVVLASKKTINKNSDAFDKLRSAKDSRKAFIAAIDTVELDRYREKHPAQSEKLYVRIVEMLSIAIGLSIGKDAPYDPLILSYDKEGRALVFLPRPELIELDELRMRYNLQKKTIISA